MVLNDELSSLVSQLASIVGPEFVFNDVETLEAYSRDESFAKPRKPCVVIKPKNTDEVQAVVKWANQSNTPLVPISSGPPHSRGDTVPSIPGAVIVDLTRMNKIITIDRRNKVAIIEPGVTWNMIQPELAKKGLTLPMPLMPRKSKSVIASLLEREPIVIPKYQWTLLEPLRCCEVIWGSGDKLWTGEAGDQPGTLEERWSKYLYQINPMGPHQTDFYRLISGAQGSMGIVTCASLKCEVLPQIHRFLFVQSEGLDNLVEFAYKVLRCRYGYELFIVNNLNLAAIFGEGNSHVADLKGTIPQWILVIGLAGLERLPEERVQYQKQEVTEFAQQCGLQLSSSVGSISNVQAYETLYAFSGEKPSWKLAYKSKCQDIFFITTLNRARGFVDTMCSLSQLHGYPFSDIGVYIQPLMQGTACHCEFNLPFNPDHHRESTNVEKLVNEGSKALMKQGAFFSRPYGSWADMVYGSDAQTTIALKKVKGIFDPNNVMNPGKLCF